MPLSKSGISAALAGLLLSTATTAADPSDVFFACASCHGEDGRGEPAKSAPNLTGLSARYVREQLERYAAGSRGGPEDDVWAQQMALLAPLYTRDPETLAAEAQRVASLPWAASPDLVTGDATVGEAAWKACAVCHGKDGEGNEMLSAPRLAGMSAWYLTRRYRHFESAAPTDPAAATMAASARSNALDDATLAAIAAYLHDRIPEAP